MIKLLHISDISKISHLEEKVQSYALEALTILDEEHGTDRSHHRPWRLFSHSRKSRQY